MPTLTHFFLFFSPSTDATVSFERKERVREGIKIFGRVRIFLEHTKFTLLSKIATLLGVGWVLGGRLNAV